MSHLSIVEAFSCCDAFLQTLFGQSVYKKWKSLKTNMNFESEKDFAEWMLDKLMGNEKSSDEKGEDLIKDIVIKAEPVDEIELLEFEEHLNGATRDLEDNQQSNLHKTDAATDFNDLDVSEEVFDLDYQDESLDTECKNVDDMDYYYESAVSTDRAQSTPTKPVDNPNPIMSMASCGDSSVERSFRAIQSRLNGARRRSNVSKHFKCQLCSAKFAQRHNLVRHKIGVHLHSKKMSHKCSRCNLSFNSRTDRLNHEKEMHAELSYPHVCHLCNQRFSQRDNLKRHLISIHQQIKKFRCTYCPHTFSQPYQRKRHEDRVHLKIKNYECHQCRDKFSDRVELGMHMVKRHGENI